jgi:NAD+ kinase
MNADTSSHALAINEVSLTRDSAQTAKIRIVIDNKVRLDELIADGGLLSHEEQPVLAVADLLELRNAVRVEVRKSRSHRLTLLFDPHHNLEERIINEQFTA